MKNYKINTDNWRINKLPDKQFENILIYGNGIKFFGHFNEDGSFNLLHSDQKEVNRCAWLIKQIKMYKSNVYIICEQNDVKYYQTLLNWMVNSSFDVDISNVKLVKPDAKNYVLKKLGYID